MAQKIESESKASLVKRVASKTGVSAQTINEVLGALKEVGLEILKENKKVEIVPRLVTIIPEFKKANSGVTLGKSWSKPDRFIYKATFSKSLRENPV